MKILGFGLQIVKQGRKRHFERNRDLGNVQETEIALPPLDGAHKGTVDAAPVGEPFL